MLVRTRRARRSHEIMIPRSGGGGRNINPGKADGFLAEHGGATPQPGGGSRASHTMRLRSPMSTSAALSTGYQPLSSFSFVKTQNTKSRPPWAGGSKIPDPRGRCAYTIPQSLRVALTEPVLWATTTPEGR